MARSGLARAVIATVFAFVAMFSVTAVAAASAGEECDALEGAYAEGDPDTCTVTTVEVEDYDEIVRPAGNSGRGWSAQGTETTTTVDVYDVETTVEEIVTIETVTYTETQIETQKVRTDELKDPLPHNCTAGASGVFPAVCYTQIDVEVEVEVEITEEIETVTTVVTTALAETPATTVTVQHETNSCTNPGGHVMPGVGKNKAIHKHCL